MVLTSWQKPVYEQVERELQRVTKALAALGVDRVLLFGSYARGDFNEASDIDLLIVWDAPGRLFDRTERVLESIDGSYPIQPLVYTPAEIEILRSRNSVLLESIEQEGRVLYDRAA